MIWTDVVEVGEFLAAVAGALFVFLTIHAAHSGKISRWLEVLGLVFAVITVAGAIIAVVGLIGELV